MKKFLAFFRHELETLFAMPTMYVVASVFLMLMLTIYGYLIFLFVQDVQAMPFSVAFFKNSWIALIFFVPLLTMRVFSDDYRSGMLRNMLTTRLSIWDIVLGKVFSTYIFFEAVLLAIFLFFKISIFVFPVFSGDAAFASGFEVYGGIFFLSILGFFYVAIGLLCSALTENQVVAGMLSFATLFGLLLFGQYITSNSIVVNVNLQRHLSMVDIMTPFAHVENFCAGVIDSRPILFYISAAISMICLTKFAVQSKVK